MAISTPAVVAGELITSAWGNTVRADLLALDGRITTTESSLTTRMAQAGPFSNAIAGGPSDTPVGASFATWLTIPSVSAMPSWAVSACITVHISNVQAITADSIISLNATMNGGSYSTTVFGVLQAPAAGGFYSTSFVLNIAAGAIAGPSILVGSRRESGTGAFRALTQSRITASVAFR